MAKFKRPKIQLQN